MKKILLLTLVSSLFGALLAQPVSFTNQSILLNSIPSGSVTACAVDMNGDDLDDIVRVRLYGIYIDFQQPDGSFTQTYFPVDFSNAPSWSIAAGDIDNNGYRDLLFGGDSAVSFVVANDDGTAYEEYMDPAYIFSQRSTFFDIDLDGNLDAFVCHDVDQNHPYRNDGNGNMVEDQSLITTVPSRGNYAAIWVDYNNDTHTDLYVTKCVLGSSPGDPERTNGLYRNNGDGTFTEVAAAANMADNSQSWATSFEDFDNDGDMDAFIINHDFANRFMRNNGNGTFTNITATTGIDANDLGAWENATADFNNDGFIDIFSELQSELYLNNGDGTFTGQNLSFDEGGIGDFNNDGFLDVTFRNTIMMNDGNDNNWIKIIPKGFLSNRDGIGVRVTLHGSWGQQMREIRSGQSFSPMSAIYAHFGIGQATEIDSMVIQWPSGIRNTIENPAINTNHVVEEVSCLIDAEPVEVIGNLAICEGESVQLVAPEGYEEVLWSNGATALTIEVDEPATLELLLFAADGCVAVAEPVVVSWQEDLPPVVEADGHLVFCEGEAVVLSTNSEANPRWSNGMMGNSITVTEAGTYTVLVDAQCSEGELTSEAVEVTTFAAEAPVTEDVDFIYGEPATLNATAPGALGDPSIPSDLLWYADETSEEILGTGSTFITDPLFDVTTFYVASQQFFGGGEAPGGKLTLDGGGGAPLPDFDVYNYFNAYEPFTIKQVDVMVPSDEEEGVRTIQLYDGNDVLLATTDVFLVYGLQTIDLDFEVPEGTEFSLRCAQNNIFRNNAGVDYPYAIGDDIGEIYTSSFGDQYYYFFYNWLVETPAVTCTSERVPVTANVVVNTNEIAAVNSLHIFPNPARDKVQVQLNLAERVSLQLQLLNAMGQVITIENLNNLSVGDYAHSLDVSDLPTGVYELRLQLGDQFIAEKLVVE